MSQPPSAPLRLCYSPAVEFPDLQTVAPYLEQLGLGLVAGFVAGYAFKKLGKLVAVAVGALFIILQVLAFQGFVTIHWGEVQARVDPLLQAESLNAAWSGLLTILTYNVTFAGGFVPAFILGMKRG